VRGGRTRLRRVAAAAATALAVVAGGAARAAAPDAPRFTLNEDMLTGVRSGSSERACDPQTVLGDLFAQLGPEAHVFPTENYYYFQFHRAGRAYAGSLRLASDTRDRGVLEFACYPAYARWLTADESEGIETDLTAADGVGVTPVAPLVYDVAFRGKTVRFRLDDLEQTVGVRLRYGELFAGRAFDESGLVFDLIFNRDRRRFYFVLDPRGGVPERFVRAGEDLLLGKRTGFLMYRDAIPEAKAERQVLIAVDADEVHLNSVYDGPFDQLPENFYARLGFWPLVYEAYPELKGELTPGGIYKKTGLIFAVSPYRMYGRDRSFRFVDACRARTADPVGRILCLTGEDAAGS
jgi:hypothetical protein